MSYLVGADVVGGGVQRALVIRVNNVAEVVKSKGGAIGDFAQKILPETVHAQFFDEMRRQMEKQFRDQGVDARITVVDGSVAPSAKPPALWREFGFGVATGIVSSAIMHWVFSRRK